MTKQQLFKKLQTKRVRAMRLQLLALGKGQVKRSETLGRLVSVYLSVLKEIGV